VEIGHDRPIAAVALLLADLDRIAQRRLGGQQQQRQKQAQRREQPPIAQRGPDQLCLGPKCLRALLEEDSIRVDASS
jgi:hypothetical protein